MIKTILVPATGTDIDMASYAAALPVVHRFAAHLAALHVRIDPVEVAVAMSTEGSGGTLLEGIIDSITRDADATEAKALSRFDKFCSDAGFPLIADPTANPQLPSAMFHVETGQQVRWMSAYGMTADLAIASRGLPGDDATARNTLEALLIETGRPLLIPGPSAPAPDFADRVTIAWKPTAQAARAVAFAMPFLTRAKIVTVLTVEEEEGRRDEAQRLVNYLAWHGIRSTAERLSPAAGGAVATMLGAASERGGLLVMGGYGHTRLREWVFGGFTQSVLSHAELPVLMAH
jgi:nucleotide-binding universal stress UspA family protein